MTINFKNLLHKRKSDDKNVHLENTDTLEQLALKNETYWKFTQSVPKRSIENYYEEYKEGHIVEAKDKDKFLSFVPSQSIALCSVYGDTLTKLDFNLQNPNFQKIKDEVYRYLGGGMMEYESPKLLVEKNYSLANPETIVMVIEMATNVSQVRSFVCGMVKPLKQRLTEYGFQDSEKFVSWLINNYDINSPQECKNVKEKIKDIYIKYEAQM